MALFTDSILWDSFLLFILFISYAFWRIQMAFRSFERTGLPKIGFMRLVYLNLKQIFAKTPFNDHMKAIYDELPDAKAFGFMQLFAPFVMVKDPEIIEKIMKKDFSNFHDHGIQFDAKTNPLERNLFNMSGAEWKALRNKLSPTFTAGKIKWMLSQIIDCSDTLIQVLSKEQTDIDIRDFLNRFTIDVIGSCAFGVDPGALKDPDCEFRKMSKKISMPSTRVILSNMLRFLAPRLSNVLKLKTFPDDVTNFFFSLTKQGFEHRLRTGEKRNDFLELLLQLREKGYVDVDDRADSEETIEETAHKLDELLTAQAFIFLVAGWENTALTITLLTYFLGKYPEHQSKVREEIKEVSEKHGSAFTYEALKDMVYLDACISESMRIFSPALLLIRKCNKDYPIEGAGYIEAGTMIFIPTQAIQRDVAYFKDPMEFRPERFLKQDCPKPPLYMPFGDGPRVCIAQRFALVEIKLAVAKLVCNFRIQVSPKVIEPVQLEQKSLSTTVKGGMWIRLKYLKE